MAEWGWRSPTAVKDPTLRVILQSLERYLIVDDQEATETVEAIDERVTAIIAHVAALGTFLSWYLLNIGAANELVPDADDDVSDGVYVVMPYSFYGIDGDGDPYLDPDGVAEEDERAWIGFVPDGVPYLVLVGGPVSTFPPFPPPLPS